MTRYFTRPRSIRPRADDAPPGSAEDTWFTDPLLPSLTVDDHVAVDTGLIDRRGDPIMRGPDPVGFHNPRETA